MSLNGLRVHAVMFISNASSVLRVSSVAVSSVPCQRCDDAFYDLHSDSLVTKSVRSKQAVHTVDQLERLLKKYRRGAEELLNEAG